MSETLESYCEYYKRPCTVSDGLCSECGERLIEPASGATEESPKTKGMTNGRQIYELWKLLDDIDTASDIFKEDYEAFAEHVYRIQRKRFEIVPESEVDILYDQFYPKELL